MKKIFAALLLTVGLSACITAPFQPPVATLYSNVKAPLQTEYNNTTLGSKIGESSAYSILGMFAFGDTSIGTAAKQGRIKNIKHADYDFTNVFFGIFTKTTVYVYGD